MGHGRVVDDERDHTGRPGGDRRWVVTLSRRRFRLRRRPRQHRQPEDPLLRCAPWTSGSPATRSMRPSTSNGGICSPDGERTESHRPSRSHNREATVACRPTGLAKLADARSRCGRRVTEGTSCTASQRRSRPRVGRRHGVVFGGSGLYPRAAVASAGGMSGTSWRRAALRAPRMSVPRSRRS